MKDRELRASLQSVGPLLPQLIYSGRVIDGDRRDAICSELGIIFPQRRLATREEACAALWFLHPERAIKLAETDRVIELARLCGTNAADVAATLKRLRPKPKDVHRAPRQSQGQKRVQVLLWVEPQFKHYLRRAGEAAGLNMTEALTRSGWKWIQETLPRAATEGLRRAPSTASVRPRRRPANDVAPAVKLLAKR
jgi:hypothetical protein